jgi:hypothetical protein
MRTELEREDMVGVPDAEGQGYPGGGRGVSSGPTPYPKFDDSTPLTQYKRTREQKKRQRKRWKASRRLRGVEPRSHAVCGGCRFLLSRDLFWKDATRSSGLSSRCKNCVAGRLAGKSKMPGQKSRQKRRERLKKYGLTETAYQAMVFEQDGECAICREPDPALHVDHCHKTGKVRALLCNRCNLSLGGLRDRPELALAAADYLWKHHPPPSDVE